MFKLVIFSLFLISNTTLAAPSHLPLQMTTEEYQTRLRQHWLNLGEGATKANQPETQEAIDGGEKFSLWLKNINKNRPGNDQLRLSSEDNRGTGIPINRPSKYGPKTIRKTLNKLKKEMPKAMKLIIYGDHKITDHIPEGITKESFIKSGRSSNSLYQTAVRWSTAISPWLSYYEQNKKRDIRGYYHLQKTSNLDFLLSTYSSQSESLQAFFKKHLVSICMNSAKSHLSCEKLFKASLQKKNVLQFKKSYWPIAKKTWDSFFSITSPRHDIEWKKNAPATMIAPFADPKNPEIASWLKENIEDEFKTNIWNFELRFQQPQINMAYLDFKPGVTPHVAEGNIIVMDANSPLQEFSVRWTIRHEYGHILRLPDCYLEFYDAKEEVAVNYQLNVTDLMCSRSGNMNQRIYEELKKAYYDK